MQTFKEVFRREEERQNLKHIGFCFLVVIVLVVGSFGLASLQFVFEKSHKSVEGWTATAPELAEPLPK